MNQEIQHLRSQINALNAQAAQIHDSFHFSPEERARLTAPLVAQVQELNDRILATKATASSARPLREPHPETPCATPLKHTANAIH